MINYVLLRAQVPVLGLLEPHVCHFLHPPLSPHSPSPHSSTLSTPAPSPTPYPFSLPTPHLQLPPDALLSRGTSSAPCSSSPALLSRESAALLAPHRRCCTLETLTTRLLSSQSSAAPPHRWNSMGWGSPTNQGRPRTSLVLSLETLSQSLKLGAPNPGGKADAQAWNLLNLAPGRDQTNPRRRLGASVRSARLFSGLWTGQISFSEWEEFAVIS